MTNDRHRQAGSLSDTPQTVPSRFDTFTYDTYEELLETLLSRGYEFRDFDSVRDGETDRVVLLRHDVDWSPERALTMALIEAEKGVTATYFFLVTASLYNPLHHRNRAFIRAISALGHRVGVHFSTHQYWTDDPGPEAVTERVTSEQSVLGQVVDIVPTVSFHIPPDWVLGRSYDGFTNAYAPPYLEAMSYISDSNQKWRTDPPFEEGVPDAMQILVHPGVWARTDEPFAERLAAERDREFEQVRQSLDDQYVAELY
jgi:hypothetical protein